MSRHIPSKPEYVNVNAEPYWAAYTQTYDFEDVEAFTLAALCNCHALAEKCQSMSFNKKGEPLLLLPRRYVSGDADDTQNIPNPFIDELANVNREIERLKAALGIQVSAKVPIRPSNESPVDRAARRKAEKDSK
jgi:hypothetical protein